MTLGQLIEACQFKSGYADSAYRPRWVSFVNEAIREFARRQPWDGLEDRTTVKTDGSRYLVLPSFVDSVISVLSITDSLPVERAGDFEKTDPTIWAQQTVGLPYKYTQAGEVAVTKEPAGYLWFQSTHASDVGALYVTGLAANSGASGALETTFSELSLSATGTSPVTLSTLFTKIFSISKSSDTNGDFYFYDAAASNAHVSFLSRTDSEARFRRLALLFRPDSQRQFEVRFRYKIPPLRQDAQAPHPAVKADYIVQHALSLHLAEQEQYQRQGAAEAKALKILEAEAQKDLNFQEQWNQMLPNMPPASDASDDFYRVGW